MEKYNWLISIVIGLIQVFIAYHVLSLSKRTSRKANFEHKREVRKTLDVLINEIYVKKSEVILL